MFPAVSPAILKRVREPFDDPDWLFELKYDGFRALAFVQPGTAHLVSRNGNLFRGFESVRESLAELRIPAILDGELACLGPDGRPRFYRMMRRSGDPVFHAFDLLWLDGQDLRHWPLVHRKTFLSRILPAGHDRIRYVRHFDECGKALFEEVCRLDMEGIVAKPRMSPYGENWLKIKNPDYSQNVGRHEMFDRFRSRQENATPDRSLQSATTPNRQSSSPERSASAPDKR